MVCPPHSGCCTAACSVVASPPPALPSTTCNSCGVAADSACAGGCWAVVCPPNSGCCTSACSVVASCASAADSACAGGCWAVVCPPNSGCCTAACSVVASIPAERSEESGGLRIPPWVNTNRRTVASAAANARLFVMAPIAASVGSSVAQICDSGICP